VNALRPPAPIVGPPALPPQADDDDDDAPRAASQTRVGLNVYTHARAALAFYVRARKMDEDGVAASKLPL